MTGFTDSARRWSLMDFVPESWLSDLQAEAAKQVRVLGSGGGLTVDLGGLACRCVRRRRGQMVEMAAALLALGVRTDVAGAPGDLYLLLLIP